MDSAKKQLADRLKSANNILVTVSRDPSIDQLAACLGLTLLLNKLNKHSVAVFSGQVPSTMEFLKPQETLEKTTDSLRDFIIALDKDKADKLRYKVEDNVVRIFITPYKTSIGQEDLEFSQGDFNVDVVIALGVRKQEDLDEAITAHGRILHDATVASINLSNDGSSLGTISWNDAQASSLSELVTDLAQLLGDKLLDNQIATALLTGIVAETDRFSNDKTSSQTMNASSTLMAAGANQQLVATKLEESEKPPQPQQGSGPDGNKSGKGKAAGKSKADPSTLSISHDGQGSENSKPQGPELPAPQPPAPPPPKPPQSNLQPGAKLVTEPPSMGGSLTANSVPEGLDPITDPMSMPQNDTSQLLSRQSPPAQAPAPFSPPPPSFSPPPAPVFTPPPAQPPEVPAPQGPQTLTEIEKSVHSPHADAKQLDTARDEVNQALKDSVDPTPAPIQALNAQQLGEKLHPDGSPPPIQSSTAPVLPLGAPSPESSDTTPQKAPPVPPPLPPQAINKAAEPQTPPNQPPPAL
ncbi:MAG TPA: hypothetical protein VFH99_03850 [Candidatus Saccharimonadales bacterium]|nr:hypothetical protein [Candidatus Saccharimonadales bacterium]